MPNIEPKDPKIHLTQQLSFKALAGTICFLVLVPLAVYVSMQTRGRQTLSEQAEELNKQIGQKIVLQLSERIASTEALTRSLAKLAEKLPSDSKIYRSLIPALLDADESQRLIAGGGIWPEPFAFEEKTVRRSFFWARNQEGDLEYLDDYNDPNGQGYHNEEWYVPAEYLKPGQVFWSKSYMDPYSLEPMVTCTVPYSINGLFSGVVTVDLRLQGISEFMEEQARSVGGYAFAVDRNNKLLSFPNAELGKLVEIDRDGRRVTEYLHVTEVAPENPAFIEITHQLEKLDTQNAYLAETANSSEVLNIAKSIAAGSYQIDEKEALRIAVNIATRSDGPQLQSNFKIADDLLLSEEAYISLLSVPSAFWKVAIAMPAKYMDGAISDMTNEVASMMLGIVFIICVAMYLFFEYQILRPIRSLSAQVRDLALDGDYSRRINIDSDNELSKLAFWYNVRTSTLGDTLAQLKSKNSQLEEARKTAELANRSKNVFLASMSHEIRTPMNGIIGLTELLKDMKMGKEQTSFVDTIGTSAESLLTLINDILDFSKIEANQLDLEDIPFDLRSVLEDLTDLIAFQAQHKGLRFSCYLAPSSEGFVVGDSGRLRQILLNLASNAMKFTEEGEISIWGDCEQETEDSFVYRFEVKDSGIGIPDTALKKLFDSFSQVDSSTTRKYGGTGLGLAICKRLCQMMGGDISVSSKLSEGSCFTFTVRFRKSSNIQIQDTNDQPHFSKIRAIIIDNEAPHGDALAAHLEKLSLVPTRASSIEEAIEIAIESKNKTAIFVGDTGCTNDAIHEKLLHKPANAKLIKFSNGLGETHARNGYAKTWVGSISKPFKRSHVTRLLRDLFDSKRSHARKQTNDIESNSPTSLTGSSVLLVEDNSVNQKVAARLLRKIGVEPAVASNGEKALALIKDSKFDLILMDWQMPVMDGIEATQELRKLGGWCSDVPVIALTANAMQGHRESCLEAGMNDYLSKPIRSDRLREMLERWLVKDSKN